MEGETQTLAVRSPSLMAREATGNLLTWSDLCLCPLLLGEVGSLSPHL